MLMNIFLIQSNDTRSVRGLEHATPANYEGWDD